MVFTCYLGSLASNNPLIYFSVISKSDILSVNSSETSVDYVYSSPTLAKIEGGILDPWPFHYIMYNTLPAGALASYFSFLFLVYFPFSAKLAMANFFSEAVMVRELAPGKERLTVSITWLMNPDLII